MASAKFHNSAENRSGKENLPERQKRVQVVAAMQQERRRAPKPQKAAYIGGNSQDKQ